MKHNDMIDYNSKILRIVSACLNNANIDKDDCENWQEVYSELKSQAVHLLVANLSNGLEIEPIDKKKIIENVGQNACLYYSFLKEQNKIVNIFQSDKINFVIIKGFAISAYYPKPELRSVGDIDIVVLAEDFNRAYSLLCQNGYKVIQTIDENPRHAELQKNNGAVIELHRYFSLTHKSPIEKLTDDYILSGIKKAEITNIGKYSIPTLPILESGIVLLVHISQHLNEGLGLRQIVDWFMYVKMHLTDEYWNQYFLKVAQKLCLEKLAITVTYICKKYLGLANDITWCDSADEEVCDLLIGYIFEKGNMGRKDIKHNIIDRNLFVLKMFRNPISAIKKLQIIGCRTWKQLEKHKWLKPFAWVYQICRFIKRGIKQNVLGDDFKEYNSKEDNKNELLRRLEII